MNQLVLKKKNELMKKKKGFTLVELIIVIAIIFALAWSAATLEFFLTAPNLGIATEAVYTKYIDGGNLPNVKSVSNGTWIVNYDDKDSGNGVTVKVGDKYMYPADKEADKKE